MFLLQRFLKLAYVLVLGVTVVLLSRSTPVQAQRAMIAPMLSSSMSNEMQYVMQARMMLMMAGSSGGMMGGAA